MTAYYNEFDKNAAQWLRNLIKANLIAPGDVDERSILDVSKDDLKEYTQCHFFAGIGGWSYALRLAGWPDDQEVWTGSCPCQPFSTAGKGKGFSDERHLWPIWRDLIEECVPSIIFGEQVAGKAGRTWLGLVSDDMEALGFAFGAADLCAASIDAPHIRQRHFWVANATRASWIGAKRCCDTGPNSSRCCETYGVAYSRSSLVLSAKEKAESVRERQNGGVYNRSSTFEPHSTDATFWNKSDWLYCRDERWRPVESGTSPLVDGVSGDMVKIRGYGNAIVPQLAAEFIQASMEAINGAD